MKFLNWKERLVVINLERRVDRWEKISSYLSKMGLSSVRLLASDYKQMLPMYPKPKIKIQEWACLVSHVRAWSIYDDFTVILEDDAGFVEDFTFQLDSLVREIPDDCDIFYLGVWSRGDHSFVTKNIARLKFGLGTHAYILTSNCADRIRDSINGSEQVDLALANKMESEKVKAYAAIPNIAFQEESFSDLKGSVAIEWKEDGYPPWVC